MSLNKVGKKKYHTGLVIPPKVMECLVMDHWHFRLLSSSPSFCWVLYVPLIWAFDTTNVYRARRTFFGAKAAGDSPTERPGTTALRHRGNNVHKKGEEKKLSILSTEKGLCNATYSSADINLSPFYFNNKHQVLNMDRSADLLVSPQGYLLLLTSFVWISCWFNRHCEDDMLINDPGYLFGIGLFLICPLSLISNTRAHVHRHAYIQSPTGTGCGDLFSWRSLLCLLLFALKGTNSIHSCDKKAVIHKNKRGRRKEIESRRRKGRKMWQSRRKQTDEEEQKNLENAKIWDKVEHNDWAAVHKGVKGCSCATDVLLSLGL